MTARRLDRRSRGLMLVALLALLLATSFGARLIATPSSLADADPPSDYLLAAPVFYPFQPPTAPALRSQLERALAELKSKGVNLKVAIVGSPTDLGAVPDLFGKPQTYASFLDREISFNQPQPLLVVMPAGFGSSSAGPPAALSGLAVDGAHQSNGLARSAILAVVRIARAEGKPISLSQVASVNSRSGGGVSPLITFGAPALLVILGALLAGRLRRTPASGADSTPSDDASG
jgi:hypothetical protein